MTDYKLRQLIAAVRKGTISGRQDSHVIGISEATFSRWVRAAEARGVRFAKNHHRGTPQKTRPWRVLSAGDFRR